MAEPDDLDFDLDAAALRADTGDLGRDVEVLAVKLEQALPTQTVVERRARRLLSREKVVESVAVRLGDSQWALRVDDGAVEASREVVVRGVTIRRESLDLAGWVGGVAAELREQAQTSQQARDALRRLVG